MSDGEHNKKPDPDEYITRCREKGITILTIGFGPDESEVGGELLEDMARSTNGTYCFEKDVIDLGNAFIEQKENASSGLILNKSEGYISQGEIIYTKPYNIGAYEYLKVILNWPGSDLDLTLIDPDGNEINSSIPGVYYSGNETKPEYILINKPRFGNWTAKIYGKILSNPEKYLVLFEAYKPHIYRKEPNNLTWIRFLEGSGHNDGRSIKKTNDGGYIIAGTTESSGSSNKNVWLIKVDCNGLEEWRRTFGGKSNDQGFSVLETRDYGYIVAGGTESFGNGDRNGWLIKTDSNGQEEWNNTFGGIKKDEITSVKQAKDGGFLLCGRTDSYGAGMQDAWFIKTDSNGGKEWDQTFGGKYNDFIRSIIELNNGTYLLCGERESYLNDFDIWIINTDAYGKEKWNKSIPQHGDNFLESIIETRDGGYVLIGGTRDTSISRKTPERIFLMKLNSTMDMEWVKYFYQQNNGWGNSVCGTSDGGYILTGYVTQDKKRDKDIILIKTNSTGQMIWEKKFGGSSDDCGLSIQNSTDSYIILGRTKTYNRFNYLDTILIKTDMNGNLKTLQNWMSFV